MCCFTLVLTLYLQNCSQLPNTCSNNLCACAMHDIFLPRKHTEWADPQTFSTKPSSQE